MKIIIAFLVALLMLSACSKTQNAVNNDSSPAITAPSEVTDITEPTLESTNDSAEHQERKGDYKLDAVPTKEAAIDVATAIFEHMEKAENQQEYIASQVLFKDDIDTWFVIFCSGDVDQMIIGQADYYSIGIQKCDGAVVSITFVEAETEDVPAEQGIPSTIYYTNEQLQEIADYDGTREEIMDQYDGGCFSQGAIQNILTYTNEDCSSVLALFLRKSGQKEFGIIFNPLHPKATYEALEVGTSKDTIKKLDPTGGYQDNLPSGKSYSYHFTTDGFYISIEYDNNGLLCNMDIVQIFSA